MTLMRFKTVQILRLHYWTTTGCNHSESTQFGSAPSLPGINASINHIHPLMQFDLYLNSQLSIRSLPGLKPPRYRQKLQKTSDSFSGLTESVLQHTFLPLAYLRIRSFSGRCVDNRYSTHSSKLIECERKMPYRYGTYQASRSRSCDRRLRDGGCTHVRYSRLD